MKRILFALVFAMLITTTAAPPAIAAKLYTTTIKETTIENVQDVLIEVMTGKNFLIHEITPYKSIFYKDFGDGFINPSRIEYVMFNTIARDGNVKMMVTQNEEGKRQRSIDHMIPLIKEVRSTIDGTPLDGIYNEAVNQLPGSGNEREKSLGLTISDKDAKGNYRIMSIAAGSSAAEKQIAIGDILLEVNGRSAAEYDKKALESYLANKWGEGSSLVFAFDRDGEIKVVSLKRD